MALKIGSAKSSDDEGSVEIVSEINITPLVDIFLVLLIIFMVTTSVMSQMGVDVNLPKASAKTASSQPEGVIVSLLKGGAIRVNGEAIRSGDWKAYEAKLRAALEKTSSHLVILEGDRDAFLGSAIEVMDYARRAGADRFAIATAPESK